MPIALRLTRKGRHEFPVNQLLPLLRRPPQQALQQELDGAEVGSQALFRVSEFLEGDVEGIPGPQVVLELLQ
jgi:hypothetical protein